MLLSYLISITAKIIEILIPTPATTPRATDPPRFRPPLEPPRVDAPVSGVNASTLVKVVVVVLVASVNETTETCRGVF